MRPHQAAIELESPQSKAWALVRVAPALAEAGLADLATQVGPGIEYLS